MKDAEKPRPLTLRTRILALGIVTLVRMLCATVRLRLIGEDECRDLVRDAGGILVTWHGRTLLPINHFRRWGTFHMLVSLSRDGDLQSEIFRRNGYHVVRGSTGRRGVAATREILTILNRRGVLAFTPDGPRGPTRRVQPGVVYFAQRSGVPIIPVGISAHPRHLLKSWDSFLVPHPFSRACILYGEPLYVAADEDLGAACLRVAAAIDTVEEAADREALPPGTERGPVVLQ